MIHQVPIKLLHPMMTLNRISSYDAKWLGM